MGKTDALAGEGDALAELEHVACIFPRGRYDLSLFPSFMVMDGQNSQFKIRCVPCCSDASVKPLPTQSCPLHVTQGDMSWDLHSKASR